MKRNLKDLLNLLYSKKYTDNATVKELNNIEYTTDMAEYILNTLSRYGLVKDIEVGMTGWIKCDFIFDVDETLERMLEMDNRDKTNIVNIHNTGSVGDIVIGNSNSINKIDKKQEIEDDIIKELDSILNQIKDEKLIKEIEECKKEKGSKNFIGKVCNIGTEVSKILIPNAITIFRLAEMLQNLNM